MFTVRVGGLAVLLVGFALTGIAEAHSKKSKKMDDAMWTGAGVMSASASGTALWQFPDKKKIDPAIFGTPSAPNNVDLLPLENRMVSADGSAYTTIKNMSAFSNKIKMTKGDFSIQIRDVTAKDTPKSADQIAMDASFIGPNGRKFRITMNKVIPVGPKHQFFGGVGTNVLMHGATGIGTALVAEEFSYITAWGIGDLYIDGEKVDTNRVVHMMVSERTRDDNYKVGFGVANPDDLEIHVMLPPEKGSPTGPVANPVPTGVKLPNGKMQPFIHVNFYGNPKLKGNQFYASK
ncbi:MAG: hypothetical protein ACC634_01195 [Hyphomicrobiales bacterium]